MTVLLPMLQTHDSLCTADKVEPIGVKNEAWRVDMTCEAGTYNWKVGAIFALHIGFDGARQHLVRINLDDGEVLVFTPCAATASPGGEVTPTPPPIKGEGSK
jgi:hypothetical protein